MDEREKIIETIRESGYGYFITHDDANAEEALRQTADALIAAGFGDVSAVKAEQEEIKLFHAEIKNGEIEMTVGSAGFKTFFALVEQIFKQNGATAFLTTTIEGGNDIKHAVTIQRVGEKSPAEELRQATELWKHEKHRAEVAERALLTACVNLIKDEDNVNMELLAHAVYTKFLRKAEKELAEEDKK